jgi:hypothetical protein
MSEAQKAPKHSERDDDLQTATEEGTVSAGETGSAPEVRLSNAEVIIGEIPDAHEPTRLLWTARCSDSDHDLLGQFGTREEAIRAKDEHLSIAH